MHAAVRGWAAGDSLGCRGQRLCGSGLLASGGVLELPHQTKRNSLLKCNVQGYMRSARAHAQTHAHTLSRSASIEALGEFFLRHLHMMEGREKGGGACWKRDDGRRSVQHCVQLVCQVVKHAADVVQDGDRRLFAGKRAGEQRRRRRRRNLVRVEDWKLERE